MRKRLFVWYAMGWLGWRRLSLRMGLMGWIVSGLWGGASIAVAAEWSIEPKFRSEGQFHDNLLLDPTPSRSIWAMKVSPDVGMSYATEIFTLKATPKVEFVNYEGVEQGDSTFTNFFLPFSSTYRTEVDRFGLDATLNRDIAFLGELRETGIATGLTPRDFRDVRGTWTRSLTERMRFQSSYQLTDVAFVQRGPVLLFDYQTHVGSIGGDYRLTEKTRIQNLAWYSNIHIPQLGFRAQTPGLDLGFSHQFSETFSISGSGGLRYVRTTVDGNGQGARSATWVEVFAVSLNKEWERSHMIMAYSRTLTPTGIGLLLASDGVDLLLLHHITHALNVSLSGMFADNDTVGAAPGTAFTSRYWHVGPTVTWRFTEYWSLDLSYLYSRLTVQPFPGETAHSNAVTMGLIYNWPKWVVSR